MPRYIIALLIFLVFDIGQVVAGEISLPRTSVRTGTTAIGVEMTLATKDTRIAAFGVDLFPAPALTLKAKIGPAASRARKHLESGDLDGGGMRFIVFGMNQTLIADGPVITLSISLPKDASGTYRLRLTNASASDARGNAVPLDFSDGEIQIGETPDGHD